MKKIDSSEIDNILNKFLVENDFDCYAELGEDFAYYDAKSLITYALIIPVDNDKWFFEYATSLGLKYDCGNFILSFFHEIGHSETLHLLEDEEEEEIWKVKNNLTFEEFEKSKEKANIYFDLPDEKLATQWAVDYINENVGKVRELSNKLEIAVNGFYKKYGLVA